MSACRTCCRLLGCYSWLPGVDVERVQDGFQGRHRLALLRLAAKLFHMGVDMDGLAYRLHRPMNCGR
jgi:hypothetical protein